MLPRAASSIILLIGGCSGGEEAGALRSIEEVAFQRSEAGLEGHTRIVGQLQEQRRSPAVFREKDDVLVIGGCQAKGCHSSSVERIRWTDGDWNSESTSQSNSTNGKSCTAFSNLDESTGIIIGGFNGSDCLKTVDIVSLNEDKVCSTSLADLPFRLKNSVAVSLENDTVLLFGGWDESRTMRTVFRLRINKEHNNHDVNMEAILPYEVEGHGCAAHEGHVYIVGGYDGVSVVDTIIRYSVADKTSEILPVRLRTARENLVCEVVFGRYIIVMAGWDGRRSLDSVEVFEIVDEHPYLVPVNVDIKLCQARNRPASVVV
ncbi:kelch repeat protein [Ancylostoma ceylanicum]|nr:kelch repeat protein [Ancylostoma ceylanicum]EYC01007.1 hypothetical protein Y032_0111g244 [Ancylostoma ceylanicum]